MELSEKQKEVLKFIKGFIREKGYPPTIREIGSHFGFTWIRARQYLHILEKKGFIKEMRNTSRGIVITGGHREARIPLLGRVYAGEPNLREEYIEDEIVIDRDIFGDGCFSLKIKGDSMISAGIFHGDYVIVKPGEVLKNGDTCVVAIDGEVTLKKVFFQGDSITLKPENPEMKSITVNKKDVNIIGKVIGIIRRL